MKKHPDNVINLNPDLITTYDVLNSITEDIEKIEEIYVIAMIDRKPCFYLSGDVKGGVLSGECLKDFCLDLLKG